MYQVHTSRGTCRKMGLVGSKPNCARFRAARGPTRRQRIGSPTPPLTQGPRACFLKLMQGSSTLRTCNPKSRAPYFASSSVRSSAPPRGFQVPGGLCHFLAWAREHNTRTKRKTTLEKQYGCLPESPSSPDPYPFQDTTGWCSGGAWVDGVGGCSL